VAVVLFTGSVHASCIVYTRPFLSFPVRSDRRFTLMSPVISQSDALAPSVPVTLTTLQEMLLHVSGAFTANDTGTILPFGGQRALCEDAMLEFASGNEYVAKDAGGFGTPRVTPAWRSRASSLLPSSHNSTRSWIIVFIAGITWLS